jgi:hypothetical protein
MSRIDHLEVDYRVGDTEYRDEREVTYVFQPGATCDVG